MIQLFKPVFDKEAVLNEISQCLDKGWTGIGYKTVEFEEAFKSYTGLPNAHFINSATSGLHLAIELVKRNERYFRRFVVTTPLTFVATNHAIHHAQHEPWFLDIDETLCMDPKHLEQTLRTKSAEILAVIYVALGGNPGNYLRIVEICNKYNIPLILDAAHAMGTYINGHHIGIEADYTVFSFQAVKNLATADSGMICCKSSADDKIVRKMSWLGISKDTYARNTGNSNSWDYDVEMYGWKYHGNSIMAAMGLIGLRDLDEFNKQREFATAFYTAKLNTNFNGIYIRTECTRNSRHLFQVRVKAESRDKLIEYAKTEGIQLGVHYKPSTEYKMYVSQRQFVPNTNKIWVELLSLPIGPHLSQEDLQKVVDVLNDYQF